MNTRLVYLALVALFLLLPALTGCRPATGTETPGTGTATPAGPHVVASDAIVAGRYLVTVGQCHDCHTPGFMEAGMDVPESDWLTGSPIGFRGPWGTTYPSNLRLLVQALSEDAFVEMLRTRKALPPMPWPNVNLIAEDDARAIYRFIHSLGPEGVPMPPVVPPDQEPTTPYFDFVPKHMERLATPTPTSVPGT